LEVPDGAGGVWEPGVCGVGLLANKRLALSESNPAREPTQQPLGQTRSAPPGQSFGAQPKAAGQTPWKRTDVCELGVDKGHPLGAQSRPLGAHLALINGTGWFVFGWFRGSDLSRGVGSVSAPLPRIAFHTHPSALQHADLAPQALRGALTSPAQASRRTGRCARLEPKKGRQPCKANWVTHPSPGTPRLPGFG
jgi:hypothetical protein